jgi:hypothetical protein
MESDRNMSLSGRIVYIPSQVSITASSCKFLNTRSMSAKRKREEENESYSKMCESVFNSCIIKLRPVPGVRKEPSLRRNVLLYNTLKHIRNEICRSESVASTPEVFSPVHYEDSVMKINDDLPGSLAENQENESTMTRDSEAEEEMTPEPNVPEPSEVPLNLVPVNDVKCPVVDVATECLTSLIESTVSDESFYSDSCSIFDDFFSTPGQITNDSLSSLAPDTSLNSASNVMCNGNQPFENFYNGSSISELDSFSNFDFSLMDFDFPIQYPTSNNNNWCSFGSNNNNTCTHQNKLVTNEADYLVQILVGT